MDTIQITEFNRFSTFVKSEKDPKYNLLIRWQSWFAQRKIPSIIARTSSGIALYRNGLIPVIIS